MYLLYQKNSTWRWLRAISTQCPKMSITFYWLCGKWAKHAVMELKCYWFKKHYFRPDYPGKNIDMILQRNVPRFCVGSICGWNLFQPLELISGERGFYQELGSTYYHRRKNVLEHIGAPFDCQCKFRNISQDWRSLNIFLNVHCLYK